MTALIIDTETTTYAKGNPFSRRNRLCYVGAYPEGGSIFVGTDALLPSIGRQIVSSSIVVGFNLKFDLHWLYRYGIDVGNRRIWDCQLAHFLLKGQTTPYPSLNDVCAYYGIQGKSDDLATKYWKQGIDTPDIDPDEVLMYLAGDLNATMGVYQKQKNEFKDKPLLYRLFQLDCQDLLVLLEMERNGLRLNVAHAENKTNQTQAQLESIEYELNRFFPAVPINWDSPEHISCFLYGGLIAVDSRVIDGTFKTGKRQGQPRYRHITTEYPLPGLVAPIKGSELKKPGLYSTDQSVIGQLKHPSIQLLLERSRLKKLLEALEGLPALIDKKDWESGQLHGNLNKCVARTGRLSASDPNQQNFDDVIKQLLESRYVVTG